MSGNKNINNRLAEFFRYIRNELSGRERNSLERGLQKDPFADEALEGFSLTDEKEAAKDILELKTRLKKRVKHSNRSALYQIAAVIAILIAISAVLIVSVRKNPENELAMNTPEKETLEISKSQPIIKSEPQDKDLSDRAGESLKREDRNIDKGPSGKSDKAAPTSRTEQPVVVSESRALQSNNLEVKKLESAPMAAMARKKNAEADVDTQALGMIKSSDSSLSEVVVEGYSTKSVSRDSEDISEYLHPQPEGGKSKFDEYVKKNLHRPEINDGGKKIVVVLSFLVRYSGEIDSIRIIKSPAKAYSDEAIRVVKSGPAWKSAINNGNPVEESVRLRVVFR